MRTLISTQMISVCFLQLFAGQNIYATLCLQGELNGYELSKKVSCYRSFAVGAGFITKGFVKKSFFYRISGWYASPDYFQVHDKKIIFDQVISKKQSCYLSWDVGFKFHRIAASFFVDVPFDFQFIKKQNKSLIDFSIDQSRAGFYIQSCFKYLNLKFQESVADWKNKFEKNWKNRQITNFCLNYSLLNQLSQGKKITAEENQKRPILTEFEGVFNFGWFLSIFDALFLKFNCKSYQFFDKDLKEGNQTIQVISRSLNFQIFPSLSVAISKHTLNCDTNSANFSFNDSDDLLASVNFSFLGTKNQLKNFERIPLLDPFLSQELTDELSGQGTLEDQTQKTKSIQGESFDYPRITWIFEES